MQRFFNLAGALGFLMSGTMVAGSLVIYTRIPSITQHYMSELKLELTKVVTQIVPAKLDDVMTELPSETGLPVPSSIKSPF